MTSDARLTMRLPGDYLAFAKDYAHAREMTLTDLFVGYIRKLKESMAVREELPESVRSMIGVIPQGARDSEEEYHDHLMERYA